MAKSTKTITRSEWAKAHPDYKAIIHGQKYVLRLDSASGKTLLVPVRVVPDPRR